ncbi:MAG: hypothetical protein JO041_07800, partial [Acidobacteria bacterium]|nr:hypothetical protein [Acidobacteriota bacterium]
MGHTPAMLVDSILCAAILLLLLLAWYAGFSHYNRRRARRALHWIDCAFSGHGAIAGVQWRSPARLLAPMVLHPNSCFRQAIVRLVLQPRQAPAKWLVSRLRGGDEEVTFEADLETAPAFTLEMHHQRWLGRMRRRLPSDRKDWRFRHLMPLVITTRREWQREISAMMAALQSARGCDFVNVNFRPSSPHFSATFSLSTLARHAGSGAELFNVL